MTYPDKCSGMGGLLAQMHLLEFHCCSREVQTLAEDHRHKVSDRLCIPQANYQRPWGEMKQVDLKQIRIGASPGPGKEKEDWWASLLRVAWSTARMGEIHNPAPRDSALSRVSVFSWAGVPAATAGQRRDIGSQWHAGSQVHRAEATAVRERPARTHSQGRWQACPSSPSTEIQTLLARQSVVIKVWSLLSPLRAFFIQGSPLLTN